MAIYCNTLKHNMQYGIDPYCFTPTTNTARMQDYTYIRTPQFMHLPSNILSIKVFTCSTSDTTTSDCYLSSQNEVAINLVTV